MSVCLCVSVSVSVVNSFVDSSVVVVDSNSELEIVSRTRRIKAAPPLPTPSGDFDQANMSGPPYAPR